MTIFVSSSSNIAGEVYNYATLNQAVQDYWARSDLASYIGYIIQGAEDTIYNDIFTLNDGRGTRDIEATLAGTINATTGTLAVPSDYLALRNAQVLYSSKAFPLQRKNAEFIYTNYPDQTAQDIPSFIARQGSSFIFGPFPDAAYTIQGVYWAKSSPLSQSNTTTWMTSAIPTVLLAACQAEAAKFLKDADAFQIWQGIYQQRLESYLKRDKAEMWSGSALTMTAA